LTGRTTVGHHVRVTSVQERALEHHRGVVAALTSDTPDSRRALEALTHLTDVRLALDRAEYELIAQARLDRIGWPRIAVALGLRSRQAAEQRWLRLAGPANRDPSQARIDRRGQRDVDAAAGPAIVELRSATVAAYRVITADLEWGGDHPRAELVHATLAMALTAPPSALYALVDTVITDLDTAQLRHRPAAVADAIGRLRTALNTARRG
jgi:hypothetical protein